jgi:hypothetical protein
MKPRLFLTNYDQGTMFGRAFVFAHSTSEALDILRLRNMDEEIVREETEDIRVVNWQFVKNGSLQKQLQYLTWLAFAAVQSGQFEFAEVYGTVDYRNSYKTGWLHDYVSLICLPNHAVLRPADELDEIIYDVERVLGLDYLHDQLPS